MKPLLTTQQAAELLGMEKSTLDNWRCRGDGPPFVRLTPRSVRYRVSDIERWIAGQLRDSTSAVKPPQSAA